MDLPCKATRPDPPSSGPGDPGRSSRRMIVLRSTHMAALVVLGLGAPTLHAQVPGVSTQTIDVDGISTRYHEFRLEDVQDTIHVSSPMGEQEADRASILAALERARPGDVVQFGPGTYLVGELIPIETPQLTMLGHPNGTTLRGCEPDTYEQLERDRQAARDDQQARLLIMRRCGVFEMTGGHGTVRGLTFEHSWMGLALGAASSIEDRMTEGGYLVENNVFRNSGNGVRPAYLSSAPTVIRGNRFTNVFHAVSGAGAGIHVVDNDISVPESDPIALPDGPGFAIGIDDGAEGCVIEGNRIEGHRAGIILFGVPGRPTRRNVIRDNSITGTVFPLRLWADQEDADPIQIEDNLIERNRIMGGVVGIALNRASGNRILDNTIRGITVRDPSLGEANGAGLWLSPGSDGNEIAANIFEDIASDAVIIEGDSNRVELRSRSDRVRDLGSGNLVGGSGGSTEDMQRVEPLYESKFVETRGIRLQYMDFGGSGLPVIFVQDFHDYFDDGSPYYAPERPAFYARFADGYRVLAPIRRGWRESDDTGWGYDVATQSEDLLALIDALGIRRVVLVGRNPANQDMTWIAEHHPERVAGLVYLENPPLVHPDFRSSEVRTFAEMLWARSCDLKDQAVVRVGSRTPWRPDFLHDPTARIEIPALRFVSPEWDHVTVLRRPLDAVLRPSASDHCGDEEVRTYFVELRADEDRVAALRKTLAETDPSEAVDHAMQRASGANLRTVVEEELDEGDSWVASWLDFQYRHIRPFIEEVKRVEATRPPAPTGG